MRDCCTTRNNKGFTLVELIVVIIIIIIISSISAVGYGKWKKSAIADQLKSDLNGVATAMDDYRTFNNAYSATVPSTFTPSKDVTLSGGATPDGKSYCVDAVSLSDSKILYYIDSYSIGNGARPGSCATRTICPIGFIIAPGSETYGTSDFCVMKYEAKNAGGGIPESKQGDTPWDSIDQNTAIANSSKVVGCKGCRLISDAEWMTLAQNILKNGSNWSGGAVGSGYVFTGHSDNNPTDLLAGGVDTNGYEGTNNFSGQSATTNGVPGNSQRRTLTLSNGNVIWDLSGNVREWTSTKISSGQPGVAGNPYNSWLEWSNVSIFGSMPVDSSAKGTGIIGAGSWNSASNGIGLLLSNPAETTQMGVLRGGHLYSNAPVDKSAGVLSLNIANPPGFVATDVGFRVTAPLQY